MGKDFITDKRIAEGYGTYRPQLHKQVLEMALSDQATSRQAADLCAHQAAIFRQGLDVGCGAGLSAKALGMYCGRVTGIDASGDMIAAARYRCREPFYTFLQCRAEEIFLPADSFDIVTAAGVTDWVEEAGFLTGLSRVMQDGGTLLVYDFWITDQMEGNPDYTDWWQTQYLNRFPRQTPEHLQNGKGWSEERAEKMGFMAEKSASFVLRHSFCREALVHFLLLQSNVNAWIVKNGEEAAQDWLRQTLTPVFSRAEEVLLFDGYYRRYRYHEGKRDFGAGQGRPDVGGSSGGVFSETAL